jgi:hypothetical protein
VNVLVTPTEILIKSDYRHEHDPDSKVHLCDFKSATVFRSVNLPLPIDVNSVSVESTGTMLLVSALKQGAEVRPKRASRRPPPKKSRARLP